MSHVPGDSDPAGDFKKGAESDDNIQCSSVETDIDALLW